MAEIFILLLCLLLLIKPIGLYLHMVYSGRLCERFRLVGALENAFGKLIGASGFEPMKWKSYAGAVLALLLLSFLAVFALLIAQSFYVPADDLELSPLLALNITISFLTGTNIQTYVPELTLNHISQNFGLQFLQFVGPAIDMAVAVALFRSFNSTAGTIGNFWQDFIRGAVFVLIPAAFIVAVIYMSQGVVQSLEPIIATTLSGKPQEILFGPVASQQAISMVATNGGGFFASSGAHPFASPTPFVGFLNTLLIVLLPASFFYLYGLMVGDRRQSLMLLVVIGLCISFFATISIMQENKTPAALDTMNIETTAGNMEGKEQRFGATNSALWGTLATSTTNGSSSASFGSFGALSVMSMMVQMLFGEVLLGGVGMGMINMLGMVIITVFLANLMIGRSPEYLRKKLGVLDIQLAVFLLVIPAVFLFIAISLSVSLESGIEPMQFQGAHGYTESLYAIISAAFNNGSLLGGIDLNAGYYNALLAVGMLCSSVLPKMVACALAGSMALKQKRVMNAYTIQTHGISFAILLLLVIILSALSYLPILMLGPVAAAMGGM